MKPKFPSRLVFVSAVLGLSLEATAQNWPNWFGNQLGNPGMLGSVVTNGDGTLTIVAGGDDIGNTSDNGYFYFTWVNSYYPVNNGDFDVKVRVVSLDTVNCPGAKVGLMARYSDPLVGPQGNDGFVGVMCAPEEPAATANQHEYRPQRGALATNDLTPNATFPLSFPNNWLRIARTNRVVILWAGADGTTWAELARADTNFRFGSPWPDFLALGVAVTAHTNGTTTTAVISQPVFAPPPPPPPPYFGTISADYVTQANGQPGIHIEWTTPGYLFASTNLVDWRLVDTYTNSVTNDITSPQMFYRAEGFMPPASFSGAPRATSETGHSRGSYGAVR